MAKFKLIVSLFIMTMVCFASHVLGSDPQSEYQKFKAFQAANQPVYIEVTEVSERFINACSVVAEQDVTSGYGSADPTSAVYRMPEACVDDLNDCSCFASTRDQVCVFECTAGL